MIPIMMNKKFKDIFFDLDHTFVGFLIKTQNTHSRKYLMIVKSISMSIFF